MDLTPEEQAILSGGRGEAAKRALDYQIEVGKFWGAHRFNTILRRTADCVEIACSGILK